MPPPPHLHSPHQRALHALLALEGQPQRPPTPPMPPAPHLHSPHQRALHAFLALERQPHPDDELGHHLHARDASAHRHAHCALAHAGHEAHRRQWASAAAAHALVGVQQDACKRARQPKNKVLRATHTLSTDETIRKGEEAALQQERWWRWRCALLCAECGELRSRSCAAQEPMSTKK
eukprot:358527-Chlamydomonas_euryale.AAC.1